MKKTQKRRLEALRESQKLVAGGPGFLFGTTPAKLERKVDDVIDFAEFILKGDRIVRSRDGVVVTRLRPGGDVSAVILDREWFEWEPDDAA